MSIVVGYRVPLELPIDLNEAHHSDHVVTVDSLTPRGAKPNMPVTRHHDLLGLTRMQGRMELGPHDLDRG
jgi:hypothetical protein